METEPESARETDTISLEDLLESLKRNANAASIHLQESIKQLKQAQKHLAEETDQRLSEIPLQPKTRLMKWLTDRNLAVESSFLDFFEVFLQEHKQEHRLDVSHRTIRLNSAACVLFGYKDAAPVVSLYALLEQIFTLYH